jgi:transcriptional regulator with XRE-family HTH domain
MIGYENSKVPRLFEEMEKRKIKPKDITAATGITAGSLTDWKAGRSAPTGKKLMVLAEFLNVPVEYLLGSEADENSIDLKIQAEVKQLSNDQKSEVLKYIKFVQNK